MGNPGEVAQGDNFLASTNLPISGRLAVVHCRAPYRNISTRQLPRDSKSRRKSSSSAIALEGS